MSLFRRIFVHDAGHKIGAIVLAVGVWYIAFGQTTAREPFPLTVRALAEGEFPSVPGNEILVRVPPGLFLSPSSGVVAHLRGPRQDLSVLTAIGASLDPGPGFERGGRLAAKPSDLRWNPARVGEFIDSMEPETLYLDFERIERRELRLDRGAVEVTGAAADHCVAHPERARFLPAGVTVAGPAGALRRLGSDVPFRLAPFRLHEDVESAVRNLRIHSDLARDGISMEPETVIVTVPVEPLPTDIRFRAVVETVALGPGAERRLASFRVRPADRERDFVIAFRGAPPIPGLRSETASEFVRLFVDLGELPPAAESGAAFAGELPIRIVFRLPPGSRLEETLEVRPADASGRMTSAIERTPHGEAPRDGR